MSGSPFDRDYVSQVAHLFAADAKARKASEAKQGAKPRGGWGNGTIHGLSDKADLQALKRRMKPSNLG